MEHAVFRKFYYEDKSKAKIKLLEHHNVLQYNKKLPSNEHLERETNIVPHI